jgi:hypothetical protein
MSYSCRLENVLKQIDYVENKVNQDLINEFSNEKWAKPYC